MAMARFDPFSEVMSLRDAVSQLFQESYVPAAGRGMQATSIMPVDLYETNDAFVVQAFMPGLTADDLTISVEQQTVTIHGEPKAEEWKGARALLQERRIGAFTRTFTLPVSVDANNVDAELVNGVLKLTLPKAETAKPRKIQVKSNVS